MTIAAAEGRLNARSERLVVVIGTLDRLPALKRTLDSISRTSGSHDVVVADAGSSDGTVEYLAKRSDVTALLQGRRLGFARAYNEVLRRLECRYVCLTSDDAEMVGGALDRAVTILEERSDLDLVGLKFRDVKGPWLDRLYMGGVSEFGILTCNYAVVRLDALRRVDLLNEAYQLYSMDADWTASILSAGGAVALTREISILHHRDWAEPGSDMSTRVAAEGGTESPSVYRARFGYLAPLPLMYRVRYRALGLLTRLLFAGATPEARRLGLSRKDWDNLRNGRFVSLFDPIGQRGKAYHFVQRIPLHLVAHPSNPYGRVARGRSLSRSGGLIDRSSRGY